VPKTNKSAGRAKNAISLVLPATSANLGPAFDAAALAFNLYLKVGARPGKEFGVEARGRDADICAAAHDHLILTTYREVLESEGKPVTPIFLTIENQIPIGKGCGSSAAARLAGIALAVHFGDLHWSDNRIVGEASRREHHPDNAAACWLGGIAVTRMTSESDAQFLRLMPKGKWPLLLAVPNEALATEEARRVLPAQYSRADAVANVQNSMLLLAALMEGRHDLLASALADRLHQPYRSPLCPLLPALQDLVGASGVLGVALSGAGPSVLIFTDPRAAEKRVQDSVRSHLKKRDFSAELISARITLEGACQGKDWKRNQ
jgi:homoserine kinase